MNTEDLALKVAFSGFSELSAVASLDETTTKKEALDREPFDLYASNVQQTTVRDNEATGSSKRYTLRLL